MHAVSYRRSAVPFPYSPITPSSSRRGLGVSSGSPSQNTALRDRFCFCVGGEPAFEARGRGECVDGCSPPWPTCDAGMLVTPPGGCTAGAEEDQEQRDRLAETKIQANGTLQVTTWRLLHSINPKLFLPGDEDYVRLGLEGKGGPLFDVPSVTVQVSRRWWARRCSAPSQGHHVCRHSLQARRLLLAIIVFW
ncbi:hypothetical protein GWK47_033294 [Chionoecetes opilio]|uniref:Uncharacterized protein n=1 Tax=Chionoecetes opilio TaxID=41210 RepID=A0A8J5D3E7_CHIOP|nr:hypothetical protein GWK47_033294 [Chionoecetes opilio]